jgi:hypothetical protein
MPGRTYLIASCHEVQVIAFEYAHELLARWTEWVNGGRGTNVGFRAFCPLRNAVGNFRSGGPKTKMIY